MKAKHFISIPSLPHTALDKYVVLNEHLKWMGEAMKEITDWIWKDLEGNANSTAGGKEEN